ncbi:MAG TPA: hypothetical protein VND64_09760 [Pirellulales bacterium]|nr:hypothetical protein [Pirellulales bacterium]
MRSLVVGALVAVGFLSAFRNAARAEPAGAAGGAVLDAIRQAKEAFHAPTDDELAGAKSKAAAARDALAAELASVPNGGSRSDALGLGGLAEQFGQGQADLARLEALERRFEFNWASAKGAKYDRLRASLSTYMQLLRSAVPQAADEYGRRIEQLEREWQAYTQAWQAYMDLPLPDRERVHPPDLAPLQEAYSWLVLRGQATAATGQVRDFVSHPNHVMDATAQFVDRLVTRDVDRPIRSDENQDGTRVSVRGELKSKTSAKFENDSDQGAVRVQLHGNGVSKVTARRGKVTVYARSYTKIEASEVVNLSERGAGAQSPQISVRQDTRPYAVSVDMRCRLLRNLVGKLACRAAWKQKPKSDQQAAAKTRRQIDEQLRQQTDAFARGANLTFDDLGVFALLRPNPSQKLKVGTTPAEMHWRGTYASALQFAAPSDPPRARPANAAATVQFHESAINNSELLLAGRTTNEADFRELVFEKLRLIPDDDARIEGREPAEITLAEHEPVNVRFDDKVAQVTLRLSSVRDQRETFDAQPWTVRAEYQQGQLPEISIVRTSISVEPVDAPQAERVREVLSRFLVAKATWSPSKQGDSKLAQEFKLGDLRIKPGWLIIVLVPIAKPE